MLNTKTAARSGAVKRESYYKRFSKRWKRRGVLEIDESHRKYSFTMYIRQGLQESVSSVLELKDQLSATDYTERTQQNLVSNFDNSKFTFVTYAPNVFESLRNRLGMFPDLYSECICPTERENKYLEFVSNSKSGQNFFLSNDKQLMIKTHTASEKNFFLKILPKYIAHFQQFPHSLLVKFLGLYKLTVSKHEPVYFIVMQSILFPDERISSRYDLKACEAGRYTQILENEGNIITVLKDLNFGDKKLALGSQRSWFLLQMRHDTEFLRNISVIDYSLLVGIQRLHVEEIKENKELASIIVRTRKSTSRQHSVLKNWKQSPTRRIHTPISEESVTSSPDGGEDIQGTSHLPGTVMEEDAFESKGDGENLGKVSKTSSPKHTSQVHSREGSVSGRDSSLNYSIRSSITESESLAQNRRLLPECRNELHVIDGTEKERYFVGIIDFFTPYGFRKRCESVFKTVKYKKSGLSYSTIHPNAYADRFQQFAKDHVI